ncbi:MAG: hypothetical protein PHU27_10220 [Salinivirgaceae bacterium]|nr:hypothetical protein [Salinivirgaceae bacterium]MDD4748124.1 hypothetical protein [Salinivirgaceae bacterium]MDY0279965.1 hypothetical protein [Salinivirgaceae bacterium]
MKFLFCPQCGIRRFHLKNEKGETLLVQITREFVIVPVNTNESVEGFDQTTLYCLGCSWIGTIKELKTVSV